MLLVVSFLYNYAWKLGGFSSCVNPNEYTILKYTVEGNKLTLLYQKGGIYSTSTLGYLIEEDNSILKVGIKYYNGWLAYLDKSPPVEQVTVSYTSNQIDKIILCGNGVEIDINERHSHAEYESLQEYIQS